jgi:hypothetical protein
MEASILKNAINVRICDRMQFNNVVSARDVHQFNNLGNTHNVNSSNRANTVINDSYNDNSQYIVGGSARNSPLAEDLGGVMNSLWVIVLKGQVRFPLYVGILNTSLNGCNFKKIAQLIIAKKGFTIKTGGVLANQKMADESRLKVCTLCIVSDFALTVL